MNSVMKDKEKRRRFFYAMNDAGMYDATIDLVGPCYREMHKIMLALACNAVKNTSSGEGESVLALDIGSGTGAEAIPLLQCNPNLKLLALDLCEPMNVSFRERAREAGISQERYANFEVDILETTAEEISRFAADRFGKANFQVIISAFTIHHFDSQQKEAIYRLIRELLSPGGVFLSGDLFNFEEESPTLTQTIFNWELDWIAENFDREAESARGKGEDVRADTLLALKEKWLEHYLHDNNLQGLVTQLEMLRNVGFSETGCPFRYWQVGLLFARKAPNDASCMTEQRFDEHRSN